MKVIQTVVGTQQALPPWNYCSFWQEPHHWDECCKEIEVTVLFHLIWERIWLLEYVVTLFPGPPQSYNL